MPLTSAAHERALIPRHPRTCPRARTSVPEFSKPMSDPVPKCDEGVLAAGVLSEESLDMYLDLGPFLNTSYHVVQVRHRACLRALKQ